MPNCQLPKLGWHCIKMVDFVLLLGYVVHFVWFYCVGILIFLICFTLKKQYISLLYNWHHAHALCLYQLFIRNMQNSPCWNFCTRLPKSVPQSLLLYLISYRLLSCIYMACIFITQYCQWQTEHKHRHILCSVHISSKAIKIWSMSP
jgi:hypothetical protein